MPRGNPSLRSWAPRGVLGTCFMSLLMIICKPMERIIPSTLVSSGDLEEVVDWLTSILSKQHLHGDRSDMIILTGMNLGDLNKVWEIKALKKPGEEEAKKILERIAKQVQPIMHKHNWRVKLLSEFCPNNPSLLGLNIGGGIQVKLRLRRPNRDWDFFPFNQILDTMLHELCHNECEDLMAKGITGTGEGFDLPGRRLGGFSRQPPLSSLRATVLAATENRSRIGSLLPSGPKRLGGDSTIMAALSPIQAAAMAAERRLQDDLWCGSISGEASEDGEGSSNRSTSKVGSNSSVHVSDSISQKRVRESNNFSSAQSSNGHLGSNFVDLTYESSSGSMFKSDAKLNTEATTMWECGTCTLLNPIMQLLAPICEVCGTQKPRDVGTKYTFWSCKFCTLENCVRLDKCSACGQWRYSHGPPVAAQAPHVGT